MIYLLQLGTKFYISCKFFCDGDRGDYIFIVFLLSFIQICG